MQNTKNINQIIYLQNSEKKFNLSNCWQKIVNNDSLHIFVPFDELKTTSYRDEELSQIEEIVRFPHKNIISVNSEYDTIEICLSEFNKHMYIDHKKNLYLSYTKDLNYSFDTYFPKELLSIVKKIELSFAEIREFNASEFLKKFEKFDADQHLSLTGILK